MTSLPLFLGAEQILRDFWFSHSDSRLLGCEAKTKGHIPQNSAPS